MYQPSSRPSQLPPDKVCAGVARLHPMPWTYVTTPGGQVIVLDAAQAQVNLFALADFAVAASRAVIEKPAPYNQSAATDTPKGTA